VTDHDWIAGERLTIPELLDDRVGKSPDATALWLDDVPYTFADLASRSRTAATALLGLGIRPGEAVALLLESCIELVDVWLAAAAAGVVSVPINIANRGDFLLHQLRDSRSVLVLVDATTAPALRTVAADLPELRLVVTVGAVDQTDWPRHVRVVPADALATGSMTSTLARPDWNAPACVLYTSGTTGPSRASSSPSTTSSRRRASWRTPTD